jgi:hypothetical protein
MTDGASTTHEAVLDKFRGCAVDDSSAGPNKSKLKGQTE